MFTRITKFNLNFIFLLLLVMYSSIDLIKSMLKGLNKSVRMWLNLWILH